LDVLQRPTYYVYWREGESGCPAWKDGFLRKMKTPDGIVTSYDFNSFGEPTQTVVDVGTGVGFYNLTSTYQYSPQGNLTSATVPLDTDVFATTDYTYTATGQIKTVTDPKFRVTSMEYDPSTKDLLNVSRSVTLEPGQPPVSLLSSFEYDSMGNTTKVTDPVGRESDFQFDYSGRMTKTTLPDPDGAGPLPRPYVSYAYDKSGNLTTVTNPANDSVLYTYGLDSQLETVTVPIEGTTAATTTYGYNDRLELTSVTDARQNFTTYGFDNLGRLTTVTDALDKQTHYAFDIADRLSQRTDARGLKTNYTYQDKTDRLEKTEYLDSSGTTVEALVNGYDRLGRQDLCGAPEGGHHHER